MIAAWVEREAVPWPISPSDVSFADVSFADVSFGAPANRGLGGLFDGDLTFLGAGGRFGSFRSWSGLPVAIRAL